MRKRETITISHVPGKSKSILISLFESWLVHNRLSGSAQGRSEELEMGLEVGMDLGMGRTSHPLHSVIIYHTLPMVHRASLQQDETSFTHPIALTSVKYLQGRGAFFKSTLFGRAVILSISLSPKSYLSPYHLAWNRQSFPSGQGQGQGQGHGPPSTSPSSSSSYSTFG